MHIILCILLKYCSFMCLLPELDSYPKKQSCTLLQLGHSFLSHMQPFFLIFLFHLRWISQNNVPYIKLSRQEKKRKNGGVCKGGTGWLEGCFTWLYFDLYWLKILVKLLPEYLHQSVHPAVVQEGVFPGGSIQYAEDKCIRG